MRASRVGVGGGRGRAIVACEHVRACVIARRATRTQVPASTIRPWHPIAVASPAGRLLALVAGWQHATLDATTTTCCSPSATRRRRHAPRMRDDWVRGGAGRAKNIFENMLLTPAEKPSSMSESITTPPNKHRTKMHATTANTTRLSNAFLAASLAAETARHAAALATARVAAAKAALDAAEADESRAIGADIVAAARLRDATIALNTAKAANA